MKKNEAFSIQSIYFSHWHFNIRTVCCLPVCPSVNSYEMCIFPWEHGNELNRWFWRFLKLVYILVHVCNFAFHRPFNLYSGFPFDGWLIYNRCNKLVWVLLLVCQIAETTVESWLINTMTTTAIQFNCYVYFRHTFHISFSPQKKTNM